MKILSSEQIREADAYTIANEPIASIDLMERASLACYVWLNKKYPNINTNFHVVCGQGNNAGDGLVIARMLIVAGYPVTVYLLRLKEKGAPDYEENLSRLIDLSESKSNLKLGVSIGGLFFIKKEDVLIDALFGTGVKGRITGAASDAIEQINDCPCTKISIDVPSGLLTDEQNEFTDSTVKADHTLTFQSPKYSFMFPDNYPFVGQFHVLPIGLLEDFIERQTVNDYYTSAADAALLLKQRQKFSHKGTHGHALICAGSKGKMGAAILATRACLKSGTGLLTANVPFCGLDIMQTSIPEVMVLPDQSVDFLANVQEISNYKAIGVGPGIGQDEKTVSFLLNLLNTINFPVVLDADAINIVAANPEMLALIPPKSILTPHPKEFERLVGKSKDNFERYDKQVQFSKNHDLIIVLKGANSAISDPDGNVFFNSSGNSGMATAGSGDVLTGIITGILAQGCSSIDAAILGVYLHGFAADLAIKTETEETLLAGNIIDFLKEAFRHLKENQ
ncbi:MAG: NAD(P)H-hydrate dehydratase [Flavobacteriales bacterium]|nr:NAD(P)H-hydrate dehydratase [Flavobacteriales bacterium]